MSAAFTLLADRDAVTINLPAELRAVVVGVLAQHLDRLDEQQAAAVVARPIHAPGSDDRQFEDALASLQLDEYRTRVRQVADELEAETVSTATAHRWAAVFNQARLIELAHYGLLDGPSGDHRPPPTHVRLLTALVAELTHALTR